MKIKLEEGQKLYIFSDPHYNHANLCKGTTEWTEDVRDFETLEEYNDTIVNNLNSVIGENDIAICLGDWAFGGYEHIWHFRKRLNCKTIHLFYGNHDEQIQKNKFISISEEDYRKHNHRFEMEGDHRCGVLAQDLFASVNQYETVQVSVPNGKEVNKYTFVAFHFPIASWETIGRGVPHLFGHVHLNADMKFMPGRSQDCGLDGNGLMPYEFVSLIKNLFKRPILSMMEYDHHIAPII